MITKKYSHASHTLKPRIARSCLKNFLDPAKPFGTHYGAILGLHSIGGADVVRELIVPNLKEYEKLVREAVVEEGPRRPEAEKVVGLLLAVLATLQPKDHAHVTNGDAAIVTDELREQLADKIGELLASRISEAGEVQLAHSILGQ